MGEPAVRVKRWTCPACNRVRTAPFCAQCGEEPLRSHDLTFADLIAELFKTFTRIDGRLLRSFRMLLLKPGELTVAHIRGERRAYLGPLPLFLLANALFFGLESLTHTNVFSSPLASHLGQQDWSGFARQLVAQHLATKHMTLAEYAPLFDQAAKLNAKSLIILMALAVTPFVAALFYTRHRPVGVHLVFSLHLYVFVLLLFCTLLVAAEISLRAGWGGLDSPIVDTVLTLCSFTACIVYLFLMVGRVHELRPLPRAAAALLLAAIVVAMVPGYRFAIFLFTLYTT